MRSETYRAWCREMRLEPRMHRKEWEFAYILQVLEGAGVVRPGSRGLGFGVGLEPIPAVLASRGCEVTVTDLAPEEARGLGWAAMSERGLAELNQAGICPADEFVRRVRWRPVDMNAIPAELRRGGFDFVWSSCALEHLGSIAQGQAFVLNSLECLKPAGVAAHTTEFNLSSNVLTASRQPTVLFRRCDVVGALARCRVRGWASTFNPCSGHDQLDRAFDLPPYDGLVHLKLLIGRYVSTSIGMALRPVVPRCP
jgi:2-polyprenyl-3-methyl-5-hydroxy-6-metoxy-1,4-benzoquinol methylase